jgi:hypothetical protein
MFISGNITLDFTPNSRHQTIFSVKVRFLLNYVSFQKGLVFFCVCC